MVMKMRQTVDNAIDSNPISRDNLCGASLSNSVKKVSGDIVEDYYEAESWQFSGCGD